MSGRNEVPQAIQAAPSVGAIAIWFSGKDINWWAACLGMIFIGVQLLYVLWKWHNDYVDRRNKREARR